MRKLRLLTLVPITLGIASAARADFDGPTPLAWRWAQSSRVPPSGMPLVDGNTIYIAVGQRVYALDKSTGNQKWKFPTVETVDGFFRSSPVVADNVIIAATDKTLYGIDPATGHQKWYYKLTDPQQGITGQPVSAGKSVVFAVGEDNLMAVNGADGLPTWKNQQHVYDRLKGNLASFQNNIYFVTQSQNLMGMDIATPSIQKKIITFSSLSEDVTPVVASDVLYVNTSSFVAALNAFSGGAKWQRDTGQDLVYGPAVSPEGVAAVSRDGILTIMDLNGHIKTRRGADKKSTDMKIDLGAGPLARPTAVGKYFVVPTTNGVVNLIDPANGDIVWRYVVRPMSASAMGPRETGTQAPDASFYTVGAAGPLTIAGDTLLMLAKDGSLLAFDKNSGVDATGPEVKLGFPLEGSQVSGQDLELIFKVADEASGVNEKTLKIAVNGEDVEYQYTADGLATVHFSQGGTNKPLQDGRAEITITVADWLGNSSTNHYAVTIDNTLQPVGRPTNINPAQGGRPTTRGGKGGGGG
jgi:outer membrane protein assembly factor BamB